jgi:hypothetical protein
MGALLAVLAAVGTVSLTVSATLIVEEFKAWTPWMTRWLIERSVFRLPEGLQDRCREEWSSHVLETPGKIGKLIVAFGFLRAANALTLDYLALVSSGSSLTLSFKMPEPESRRGAFTASTLTNLLIMVLLILFTAAIRRVEQPRHCNSQMYPSACGLIVSHPSATPRHLVR